MDSNPQRRWRFSLKQALASVLGVCVGMALIRAGMVFESIPYLAAGIYLSFAAALLVLFVGDA